MHYLKAILDQLQPWEVWSLLSFVFGLVLGKVISYWEAIALWCGL